MDSILYGDCLELMKAIPDKSIDLILCDLPYGVTRNKWDSVIEIQAIWNQYNRIIKGNAAIILFGQGAFSAKLILSNIAHYRYSLIWQKTGPSSPFNANIMPLRSHEDILIFYAGTPTYNPQKTTGHARKVSSAHHKRNSVMSSNYGKSIATSYDSTERFPKSVLTFGIDKQKSKLHPTQKPLALCEWLIKSYSNEGDLVLDNCAGSGTTGLACMNTSRNFILMEKEQKYMDIIINRLRPLNNR